MEIDRGTALVVVLGGIGLLYLMNAAASKEDEDHEEFEEQHYRAFGFEREEEPVARQLMGWTVAMCAIGAAFQQTPALLEELGF